MFQIENYVILAQSSLTFRKAQGQQKMTTDMRSLAKRWALGGAVLSVVALGPTSANASTPLSADLWAPSGVTSILLGGGRAHVADESAADNNPAGIALQKVYALSGNLGWTGQKARQAEAAICDSATSEISACIKFRQTQNITGSKDRRYTLGAAEALEQFGGILFGLAGDFVQFSRDRSPDAVMAPRNGTGQRVRFGVVYPLAEGVALGASSDGLYDTTGTEKAHGLGVSAQAGKYFLFSADLNFNSDELRNAALGLSVFPQSFLDLAVSYGYDPRASKHQSAAGVVVKSQQARILYSLVHSDRAQEKWKHLVGVAIYTTGDAGAR